MGVLQDYTDRRFGRLVAKEFAYKRGAVHFWHCVCDCGNTVVVAKNCLPSGNTQSCGCLNRELCIKRKLTHGHSNRRGKGSASKTYSSWQAMKKRCTNPKATDYAYYGGRGITVCYRWRKFENFIQDMGERPEGMTLDRKNPNGNYTPRNCKWSTYLEQRLNQREAA